MSNTYRDCVFAGVLAGLLYIATAAGLLIGILVQLLPLTPIFWAGLRFGVAGQVVASVAAYGLFAVAANGEAAFLVVSLQGLPALILTFFSTRWILTPTGERFPLPMGNAITYLVLYIIFFFSLISWYLGKDGGSLQSVLAQDIKASEGLLDPGLQLRMENIVKNHPYVIYAVAGWGWATILYLTFWVSHLFTASFWPVKRFSLRIDPFPLSPWVPLVIVLAFIAGMVGEEGRFIFFLAALILGYLYFIYGIALIHSTIGGWKNRAWWYGGLYLVMLLFFWPALLIAAYGLGQHLALFVGGVRGNTPQGH